MLKLAAGRSWACRHLDLSIVGSNFVANLGVPCPACDVENARLRAIVVAAKPSTASIEPEGGQAVIGTVGDLTGLRTGYIG